MIYKKYINNKNIQKVREMDKYCMRCGSSWNLEVHHIIGRGVVRADFYDNMIVLCRLCHRKIHDCLGYKEMVKVLKRYEKADFFRWGTALAYLEERV